MPQGYLKAVFQVAFHTKPPASFPAGGCSV